MNKYKRNKPIDTENILMAAKWERGWREVKMGEGLRCKLLVIKTIQGIYSTARGTQTIIL